MTGIRLLGFAGVLDLLDYEPFGTVRYVVSVGAEYAVYVEYGTSRNQAQPYLRPAVEQAIRRMDVHTDRADSPQELAERLALEIEAGAKERAPVDTGNLRNSIQVRRLQ